MEDSEAFQDVDLMLFDKVIAFDNLRQKIILIANMRTADGEIFSLPESILTPHGAAILHNFLGR